MGHRHRLVVAGLVIGLHLALAGVAQAAEGNGLIAFQRGFNGKAQIFVMRSDGSGLTRISDGTAVENDPLGHRTEHGSRSRATGVATVISTS